MWSLLIVNFLWRVSDKISFSFEVRSEELEEFASFDWLLCEFDRPTIKMVRFVLVGSIPYILAEIKTAEIYWAFI